jgi:hypothetical protein
MTTKPKTRKAPAVKPATPKNGATVAPSEPKREVSEIRALVSRWKWLKADADYQATTADTEEKSERLIAIHDAEQEKIEENLATIVPQTFSDVYSLLDFLIDNAERGGCVAVGFEINILRNVGEGLPEARYNEMEAEWEKASKAAIAEVRSTIDLAFKVIDSTAARRNERAAA